ncbi:uncharacterized protein PpBr36_10291 [Pyricularia pennisetigena]|uniref:uncharacterized protein n=1 Tax=Pyricularia pennisetigena TaxID=1578925 RepID=UPI0011517FD3|nr:uncharacterized protein PpBr36_10291 [Pyricularia pennisetigena]TLS21562.1 hypothetical protein PpBr36_10291 [Pyricularia pennisetigena]
MTAATSKSCLERLEEMLDVDVDDMDADFIRSMPVKPHDQTSNQAFVDVSLALESNRDLIVQVATEMKGSDWLAIYTRIAVLMCRRNLDLISGRVLLQTSPAQAYDTAATLAHARLYDAEFARAGVPRDRFCIKIPSTGPGLNAAKVLQDEGIATLGTALFSVVQAVACSQAGCLSISPYFNEIYAHDLSKRDQVWPKTTDPVTQHPMAPRLVHILETYRRLYKETGKMQPLVKSASFISVQEAMAAAEMGCQSATLSREILTKLAETPYDAAAQPGEGRPKPAHAYDAPEPLPARLRPLLERDPLTEGWDGSMPSADVDYLADGGAALQRAIDADPATRKRVRDALDFFVDAEERSRRRIEAVVAALG